MKRTMTLFILLTVVLNLVAQNTKIYNVNGVSFKMILVQGGTFTMGCTSEQSGDCDSDEKPSHSVTLSDFWMGETEVTQALWKAVMGSTLAQQRDKRDPSRSLNGDGDNYAMYYVNYTEAVEFCSKLNSKLVNQIPSGWRFTLPTEAQWEYAARGGKNKSSYKYAGSNSVSDVAWHKGNSSSNVHPVKGKKPNALGLYDMSGNVWEWCSDWYSSSYYGVSAIGDPKGPSSGSSRVMRGGAWGNNIENCRVSNRFYNSVSNRYNDTGFRVVLVHK